MAKLDPRKETVLRAVVIEYVGNAEPVGSEALARRYELGVRSATIRHELSELTDIGLLEQPHTSAGRIPSDSGYRYFVDRLIVSDKLEEQHKKSVKDAVGEGDALNELLRDTARAMSRLTHLLSVATTSKEQKTTVKTAILSALDPARALLVFVLSNGHVENKMIELPAGVTLEDIGAINESLLRLCVGQTLKGVSKLKSTLSGRSPAADKLNLAVWTVLRSFSKELTRGQVIAEGHEFMLAQPEFHRDEAALSDFLNNLSQSELLYEAIAGDPVKQVTIGTENKPEAFRRMSVIRQSFFVGEAEAGVIAIVGPTRLNYEGGILLVNFTAQALSHSLSRYFG